MTTLKQICPDLLQNPWQARYIWPIMIINITGSFYGYWWYRGQLSEYPWYLWVLISDSPLSTTLFALALALALLRRRNVFITALALATTLKYGLWALVILTHYWLISHQIEPVEVGLWVGHLGMVLQGLIFARGANLIPGAAAAAVTWMALNDWVDYVYNMHSYLFLPNQENLALLSAVLITLIASYMVIRRAWRGFERKFFS